MFFFGSQKKKSKKSLIVSVESSHIRACFVSAEPYQKPYILAENIKRFSGSSEHLRESMRKTIHNVLRELFEKHPMKVDDVYCILGTPWFYSWTYTYLHDEEAPFLFRERDVKKILKDAVIDFKRELHKDHNIPENSLELIEKNVVHIALNGYEVSNLHRHHVRRAEVTSYVSYGDRGLIQEIKDEIGRQATLECHIHTSTLVQYVVARDAFEHLSHFVLVSVDGNQTEITLIQDGALVFGTTFSLGDSLIETHAKQLGYSVPAIVSELGMLANNTLHQESGSPVLRVVSKAREEWREAFFNCIQELSRHNTLPNQVVVLAKPKTFHWIHEALVDPRNKHLSVSDQHLHAILMNAENIQAFVGSKIHNPDLKLMMYSSFTTLRNNT